MPVDPELQDPFGTYATALPLAPEPVASSPSELVGTQAAKVALVCVTLTFEHVVLLKFASPTARSLMLTKYVSDASDAGRLKLKRLTDPTIAVTLLAAAVAADAPPQVSEKLAMILDGVSVPAGMPDAMTLTLVTPATPLSGSVAAARFTAADAVAGIARTNARSRRTGARLPAIAASPRARLRGRPAGRCPEAPSSPVRDRGPAGAAPASADVGGNQREVAVGQRRAT